MSSQLFDDQASTLAVFSAKLRSGEPLRSGFEAAALKYAFSTNSFYLLRELLNHPGLSVASRLRIASSELSAARSAWLSRPDASWEEAEAVEVSPGVEMMLATHATSPGVQKYVAETGGYDALSVLMAPEGKVVHPEFFEVLEARVLRGDSDAVKALLGDPCRAAEARPSLFHLFPEPVLLQHGSFLGTCDLDAQASVRLVRSHLARLKKRSWEGSWEPSLLMTSVFSVLFSLPNLPGSALKDLSVEFLDSQPSGDVTFWVPLAEKVALMRVEEAEAFQVARRQELVKLRTSNDQVFLEGALERALKLDSLVNGDSFTGFTVEFTRSLLANSNVPLEFFSKLLLSVRKDVVVEFCRSRFRSSVTASDYGFLAKLWVSRHFPLSLALTFVPERDLFVVEYAHQHAASEVPVTRASKAEVNASLSAEADVKCLPWVFVMRSDEVLSIIDAEFEARPGAWEVFATLADGFTGTFAELLAASVSLS